VSGLTGFRHQLRLKIISTSESASSDFLALLGDTGWIRGEHALGYGEDWLKLAPARPIGVARPDSTASVADCIQLCRKHGLSIVPQGGNTGMVLGSVPRESDSKAVIVSTERMNTIGSIDPIGKTVHVQAGVVLEQLQQHAATLNLALPLHLGSGGSAQMGGLISTNAGGSHAFRDGMMADQVLGLEVVLPNGEIWDGNRSLIKDNAGYALKRLFCGAEGTLGIVTGATLRLVERPADTATMLLACDALEQALHIQTLPRS